MNPQNPTDNLNSLSIDAFDLTDHIRVGGLIAKGTFGHLLKGKYHDLSLVDQSRRAAPSFVLKVIVPAPHKDREEKSKWFRQIKVRLGFWRNINHDNVLPLVGIAYIQGKGIPALVVPRMEHGNVTEFLQRNPRFPAEALLRDVIKGLDYLHASEPPIIHGDLKAANVLINEHHQACLCDFGLTRFALKDSEWRAAAEAEDGIQRWMAPELFGEETRIPTKESDIYAYGMTCYEIHCGQVPFGSTQNVSDIVEKIKAGQRPERIVADHHVWKIITRCWVQEAGDRPMTTDILKIMRDTKVTLETIGSAMSQKTKVVMTIQDIPSIVILEILEYLDMTSLIRCQSVCSGFRSLIGSASCLQYKIELALAGQEDGNIHDMSTRRKLLREHQERWTRMRWTRELRIPMRSPAYWELSGGILGQTRGHHDSLHFTRLPSKCRGIQERDWTVGPEGFVVDDFEIDPGQDLLVMIETPDREQNDRNFKIHLRSLSTGEPHPLAPGPCVLLHEERRGGLSYCAEICGDVLGILFCCALHDIEVVLWNWKTGKVLKHVRSSAITSMTILSESHIVLGCYYPHTEDMRPCLTIVNFAPNSDEKQRISGLDEDIILRFPPLADSTTVRNILLRSNPRVAWNQEAVPFSTASENRLCVVYFLLPNESDQAPCFVTTQSSLLSLVQFAGRYKMKDFDWYMWGPDSCRFIPRICYSQVWFLRTYGMKLVAERRSQMHGACIDMYDFNQLVLEKRIQDGEMGGRRMLSEDVIAGEEDNGEMEGRQLHITAPSKFEAGKIFRYEVETRLAYSRVSRTVPNGITNFSPLLSEDGLVLVDKDRREFCVLTV